MNWQEVCEDSSLQNLPFKIELNEWGNIIMSPASNRRGKIQMAVGLALAKMNVDGEVISECSIETHKGVKVADVAWASNSFIKRHDFGTPYQISPEIVVEIISPSNSSTEITEKVDLYLAKGAKEAWLCDENGRLSYHSYEGELKKSKLFPKFQAEIK